MRHALALLLAAPLMISAGPSSYETRVANVLAKTPLIDGHNDWAETLTDKAGDARWTMDLTRLDPKQYNTDITRLRAGRVGGQFWSVYVSASLTGPEQVKDTLEQIALMKEIFRRHPDVFAQATTAADVRRIHAQGKIASMFGVEGGGQIDGSFISALRRTAPRMSRNTRSSAWTSRITTSVHSGHRPTEAGLCPYSCRVATASTLPHPAHTNRAVVISTAKISPRSPASALPSSMFTTCLRIVPCGSGADRDRARS